MAITITSPAFNQGESIPKKHTCDGSDLSPQLVWSGFPQSTKSFALISDDPDAPVGTWVHWVMYNIPREVTKLQEGYPKDKKLQDGTCQGMTDFRSVGYGGPCPPSGVHRYYFKIYALDTVLNLTPGATKKELLAAMDGHILDQGELMGTYSR